MALVILLFLLCSSFSVVLSINDVYVKNLKLFVNSQEFIVKGIDYSPAPIGEEEMASSGYGGGGYCSAKLTPWGEYKSACYDSDYFDGSTDIDATRFPTGFLPIWQRDFPNILATGANTIRLYNANPSTKAATKVYRNLFTYSTGKDHTQFMKYCEQHGLYVIFPLFSDELSYDTYDELTYKRYLRWQIDEVGNSSALLMWQLGNEMAWVWSNDPRWDSPAATDKFNRYLDYIRRYTLSKWNRSIPITAAIPNVQGNYNFQYQNWHVDIFSANVFGTSFGNLFTGSGRKFKGITSLACTYDKPFLMTEIGPTYVSGQVYTPGDFNTIWYNVVQNIPNGLIGGVYFEQTDEPALGKNFGLWGFNINTLRNGSNSIQPDVFLVDLIYPKQQFYDVVNGTYNGAKYNMNENIFTLLNRKPTSLSTVTNTVCSSIRTLKSCPGTGTPKCSGNGVCDRSTGKCSCADGWSGTDCSTAVCPGSPACSRRGVCSTLVSPPECICNTGYYNTSCEASVSSVRTGMCPNGCSKGNGVCNTATKLCACWPGWSGADCTITVLG